MYQPENWVIMRFAPYIVGDNLIQYRHKTFWYHDENHKSRVAMIYIINDIIERMRVIMEHNMLLVEDGYTKYLISKGIAVEPAVTSHVYC
jgi:hypothetical protein